MNKVICSFSISLLLLSGASFSQDWKPAVIAYYSGNAERVDSFDMTKLSHIIFSFGHLKGNRLNIDDARDTLTIQKLVAQKSKNPSLKILLSLGGWGGCKPCSDAFSTEAGRKEFAVSVKNLLDYFKADGIDLDWEYPSIEGHPGHPYKPEDKANFTDLTKQLRIQLGKNKVISFAAGGFTKFLEESVDWKTVMPNCDFVNMMTYDLVNGYSTTTGHHTPLYSTPQQKESSHNAISYLLSIGVPSKKIVLGSAFYGRVFDSVQNVNNGLYQPGRFKSYISFRTINQRLKEEDGFTFYRDEISTSPYGYNPKTLTFVTYEDEKSIATKTRYVIDKKLFGIMFWELTEDKSSNGLLQSIDEMVTSQ